jgi:hypothetical protein
VICLRRVGYWSYAPFAGALVLFVAHALGTPQVARAQIVTAIRIPASEAAKSSKASDPCTAKSKRLSTANDGTLRDTLRIRVEGDLLNTAVPSPVSLTFSVSGVRDSLAANATERTVAAGEDKHFIGSVVTITRTADNTAVCSLLVPKDPDDDSADNVLRHPFRVGVGASFDFLHGLSKTNLYYDVSVFLPDRFRYAKQRTPRFGVEAGLANGRLIVASDTIRALTVPGGPSGGAKSVFFVLRPTRDSTMVITQTYSAAHERTLDRLGLFLAPIFSIGQGLYWTVHVEGIKRDYTDLTSYKAGTVDTLVLAGTRGPKGELAAAPGTRVPDSIPTSRVKLTQFDALYATGPVIVVTAANVEFRAKAVLGIGDLGPVLKRMYLVNFRLTDFDNGFKLGGEVRGIADNGGPAILVYLAKDFDLKRLAGFLVGNGGN